MQRGPTQRPVDRGERPGLLILVSLSGRAPTDSSDDRLLPRAGRRSSLAAVNRTGRPAEIGDGWSRYIATRSPDERNQVRPRLSVSGRTGGINRGPGCPYRARREVWPEALAVCIGPDGRYKQRPWVSVSGQTGGMARGPGCPYRAGQEA